MEDLTGRTFGRLTVRGLNPRKRTRRGKSSPLWDCLCSCGTQKDVGRHDLTAGRIGSCGCLQRESMATRCITHGDTIGEPSPEFRIWTDMRRRCSNANVTRYRDYGGRGVAVCARWQESFAPFLADMGRKPSEAHSIDRIDNDKGYWCGKAECPECGPAGRVPNCRWATQKQQTNNKRNNRRLTLNGVTKTLAQWAEETGIGRTTIWTRLDNGWSVEKALTQPPKRRKS